MWQKLTWNIITLWNMIKNRLWLRQVLQYVSKVWSFSLSSISSVVIFPGYPVCKAYWGFPGYSQESRLHRFYCNNVGDFVEPSFYRCVCDCDRLDASPFPSPAKLSYSIVGNRQVNSLGILDLAVLAFSSSMWDEAAIRWVPRCGGGKMWHGLHGLTLDMHRYADLRISSW